MKFITDKQKEVLDVIKGFILIHHYSPTISEIGEQLGIKDSSVVSHLEALRKKDYLTWEPGKCRSLRPIDNVVQYVITPIPNHTGLYLCRDKDMTATVIARFLPGEAQEFAKDVASGIVIKIGSAIGSRMFINEERCEK